MSSAVYEYSDTPKDSVQPTTTIVKVDRSTGALLTKQTNVPDPTSPDGFAIPEYDKTELTYVASGDGLGEIATITYSKDGETVATLTLAYDANDNLASITKS